MGLFEKKKKLKETAIAKPTAQHVPRRLKRYYRNASSIEERKMIEEVLKSNARKETVELALQEVKKFKQKHSRLPEGSECDEIAENIFSQLKKESFKEVEGKESEGPRERFEKRKMLKEKFEKKMERETTGESVQAEEESEKESKTGGIEIPTEKALSLEGLELPGKKSKKNNALKLEELNLAENAEELKFEGLEDVENIGVEHETEKNKCPNCSNKTEDFIFCPECGSAFCTHCAKRIQTVNDKISYVCPKCGKEFKMMKKARI